MKLLLILSATGALAAADSPLLAPRQLVQVPCADLGLKTCGGGCIRLSWTCCPGGQGGCPPQEYCDIGSDGEPICCPRGEVCQGPGGVNTDAHTYTRTDTIPVPGETSTIVDESIESAQTPGYEEPTESAESITTPEEVVIETTETNKPVVPTYHEPEVTPKPVPIPGPGGNGTKPNDHKPEETASAIVNSGASNSRNIFGGLLAGAAALLI
ncbi:hypothetical protein FALCPG4_015194 [Fusarium falciforme]